MEFFVTAKLAAAYLSHQVQRHYSRSPLKIPYRRFLSAQPEISQRRPLYLLISCSE